MDPVLYPLSLSDKTIDQLTASDLLTLCCDGEAFYRQAAVQVDSFSLRKLLLEMAYAYQSVGKEVESVAKQLGVADDPGQSIRAQIKILYLKLTAQLKKISDNELIDTLLQQEKGHLNSLKPLVKSAHHKGLKMTLSDAAVHIQEMVDKLSQLQDRM